jgi:hypothetical protein
VPGDVVAGVSGHAVAVLDVVIPVYNEQVDLEPYVRRLRAYLVETLPYPFVITIADNASTDDTAAVAGRLAAEFAWVAVEHVPAKGRGRALHAVWSRSSAPVLAWVPGSGRDGRIRRPGHIGRRCADQRMGHRHFRLVQGGRPARLRPVPAKRLTLAGTRRPIPANVSEHSLT